MEILLLFALFASFFVAYFSLPFWIKAARRNGFVGRDIHKNEKKDVAEGGGIPVLMGVCSGILLYIAINVFLFKNNENLIYIFAILSVMLITTILGLMDDLLGWKKGLSRKIRIFIVLFAAVPLMAINAGVSSMSIPFFGDINFGVFYPLIIIPLGVVGATTTYNFLAGYNGLESSQGIIILSALAVVTYMTGNSWLSMMALFLVFPLIAFYIFNKHPAEIFPGDVLTYSVGSMIACVAILGNIEKIAVFFFLPYIIETILKARGKLVKESFGKLNKDGSLEMPYEKIYGLEHFAIYVLKKIKPSKKVYEKDVVYLINGFQISIILLGFLLFM